MIDNKIEINKEEIKETVQSSNQVSKENEPNKMRTIVEERKSPRKKDKRPSLLKSINKNLPLFEIMKIKGRDLKNYDKISFEFNKIFKLYKQYRKTKELKIIQSNKNVNILDKKKNKEQKNKKIKFNMSDLIKKLETPIELRTIKDIYLIRKYIKTTQIGSLFQNEINPKSDLYNKLLTFLSFQMKFKKIKKDEILFKIGSFTDYFYLIMEGCVEILKPMSKIYKISGYEYFIQLMNYRKKNEKYLYSLCIKENLRNFEIKTKDGDLLPYIFITYKLDEIKNRYFVDFRAVLDLVNITPEELGLDKDKIHSNGYIFNKSKMIKLRMPIITQHELKIYKFIDDKINKKDVILFQYKPFLRIGKNRYFGEASFSGKGVRNGTAKIVEDCYFGYLDIQLYNLNFYEEKKAIFEKKVNFLYNNFFFGKISLRKFETQFFNWFISEEYKNNDFIYLENSQCQFIYFIEEGTIELTSHRTILEIQVLLEKLEEKRLSMKEKGEKIDYNILNNDWFDFENHVNKDQINKILILGKNNVMGLESFYYQIPFLTNARVITPKAKLVKIDNEHLYQILIRSSECLHELETRVHSKMDIITNRFFSLNNIKLMLIDDKITREENIKYENHIKEKMKESNLRINSPFPEKKIEILKKININDTLRRKNKLLTSKGRYGSSRNLSNLWVGILEKNKNKIKSIENKENKENKGEKKKKYLYDFFSSIPDSEEQLKNKKNRKMINSAGIKNIKDHSFDMKNYASADIEENLLKKAKNEIKTLKENKYFMSKINTEENKKKEEDNEENIFQREKEMFFKRKFEKKENIISINNNINDSKKKEDIKEKEKDKEIEKEKSFVFITKFEEKKKNNNLNEKGEITPTLPSIIKPSYNQNNLKNLSIISRNKNIKSISIDNANKIPKKLNINFRYSVHLIKSYSYINKNNGNYIKPYQELNVFDPRQKYNIFNEDNYSKDEAYKNLCKSNKLKGLNEFGFPLKASDSFIPKIIKGNDLNIKMQKYQEYRRRLHRKIADMNENL